MQKEYGGDRIIVEGIDVALSARDIWMRNLSLAALATRSVAIKRMSDMNGRGAYFSVLLQSHFGRWFVRFLSLFLTPRGLFDGLFKKYAPNVVCSTDVQNEIDVRLMHEARRRKVPLIGMVRSWDNLTIKGLLRLVPDVLLVQNKLTESDAIAYHGIARNKLKVVGVPHYDAYCEQKTCDHEKLMPDVSALSKRILLYIATGDRYIKNNTVDCELLDILASLRSKDECIIVRLPVADTVQCLSTDSAHDGIFFEQVDKQRFARRKFVELSRADDMHLQNLLCCADIVVTGPSTMCVDAALFNTPVILVGFDGTHKRLYKESIARYYDYDHFKSILASKGVWYVKSADELGEALAAYRVNPALHAEGRKKIIDEQTGGLLGQASQNLAAVLVDFLRAHTGE
ncbi:MAG: hypothetical protein G01um101448_91 [Parcubacteria group bacterium Gr01-1014_48]|nr:MAG: hypothetical protein Greene041614_12 [Parcubacteria group bacterium Greene0416_14]TSC74450.1 MAG: hypothetical protein G01um101448_91 [Parcubacteria group bacterium Gr01-1014_48]TSD01760.1 MAG: hypothetical protein Greene101415_18 [Parcubacteria group bacterium Greene1014_15]TSD08474.1 MAG: hypothetical protein Greene07144_13 [Parcubacteria group bacterium Greene0714_4]